MALDGERTFVRNIVEESFRLLDAYYQEDKTQHLRLKFLTMMLSQVILDSLSFKPDAPCSREELYEYTKRNFEKIKLDLQTLIAVSFEQALLKYSGKFIEYFVQIRPVPEPVSKTMN